MMGMVSFPLSLSPTPTLKSRPCFSPSIAITSKTPNPNPLFSNSKLQKSFTRSRSNCRGGIHCNSSTSNRGSPGPGSGENENKVVLDAFFLGKAFAEALNERIGSTVGEILSVVGQWQAKQQKQVQDFQEEVIERAKRAKARAAMEVMEDQSFISMSSASPPDSIAPVVPSSSSSTGPTMEDPGQGMLKD